MKVAVVGTGYVGLVAGACFADTGNDVVCADVDAGKVARLTAGDIPIYEPGLGDLVKKNLAAGRLEFSVDVDRAIAGAEVVFLAVGTPSAADGSADLTAILDVAGRIGRQLSGNYKVVAVKSTVPCGTNAKIAAAIAKNAKGAFDVVSNPEFLKEGTAVDDFFKPDRVLLGTTSEKAAQILRELYEPFVRTGKPILVMDPASAEMAKYAANAMLATKISFMNEIARLCEATGADVESVRRAIGSDSRIGPQFIFPGLGYGGSCFPKDVLALSSMGKQHAVPMRIADAVDAVNRDVRRLVAEAVLARLAPASGKTVAIWGLSFKPKTDDLREAPAMSIVEALLAAGVTVAAFDPVAMDAARAVLGTRIRFATDPYDALAGAHACVLATEWNEFRHPDFARMKSLLADPVVFDGRNVWDPARMGAAGFEYHGVGRRKAVES